MPYSYSELDNKNIRWFTNDLSRATLLSVKIVAGKIRGLERLQIDFTYPVTAIAGRNGSGKTTVLALAACAFHNNSNGFCLPGRKTTYYTYSDFFVQTAEEISVGGIAIDYQFLHNKWRLPASSGPGWQRRVKRRGGRWTNYESRVNRTVVYLGIDRIVPHAERSISKSYRRLFKPINSRGWEDEVKSIVGRILGLDYDTFEHRQHSRYRIPIVRSNKAIYSGFNMGAGEESLFELFSIIRECPDGSLVIIDEIELGLHEKAQAKLIHELKSLCERRKFQIICTTHSPCILECLPPEGRIFLERVGSKTRVIPEISAAYATGKLSGRPNVELDILVEDESAKLIIETCLQTELRYRTKVINVGSATAVIRHLAARYREARTSEVCVLLDGDQSSSIQSHLNSFLKTLEISIPEQKNIAKSWLEERLNFLPSSEWPKLWVVSQRGEASYTRLCREFSITPEKVDEVLNAAKRAGKHNEFYEAANALCFDKSIVANQLIKAAFESSPDEADRIINFVLKFLQ